MKLYLARVWMLRLANSWKVASSPRRRATSPLSRSSRPSTAKSIFAALSTLTKARRVRWLRMSKAPSPTQNSTSVDFFSLSRLRFKSAAQFIRPPGAKPPGLSVAIRFSRTSAPLFGVAPFSRVRWRRMSTMASTCSIIIGHSSTQARQVVQDHRVSASTSALPSRETMGWCGPPLCSPSGLPG
ncbi:hypothetical protein D9M73_158960 [compost metagenome]